MRKNKIFYTFILCSIILSISLMTSSVSAATNGAEIIYGPEKISTGGFEETPKIAVDSTGGGFT